jgi:hypothetical protein
MQGHNRMETSIEQIPTTGQLQLTIQVSANVNYSAAAARRIVGRFVADEIGYLLRASEPTLVVSDRIRWRVPVTLAYPGHGVVGTAGTLDVDVETGQLNVTPAQIGAITQHATDLAAHYTTPASSAS